MWGKKTEGKSPSYTEKMFSMRRWLNLTCGNPQAHLLKPSDKLGQLLLISEEFTGGAVLM